MVHVLRRRPGHVEIDRGVLPLRVAQREAALMRPRWGLVHGTTVEDGGPELRDGLPLRVGVCDHREHGVGRVLLREIHRRFLAYGNGERDELCRGRASLSIPIALRAKVLLGWFPGAAVLRLPRRCLLRLGSCCCLVRAPCRRGRDLWIVHAANDLDDGALASRHGHGIHQGFPHGGLERRGLDLHRPKQRWAIHGACSTAA
mmetsp:Transcript_3695/g.10606  ORF Transcript_3695/g.10606 Transcript_3695/m.10606 type:complete len:202 (-) Transcript_3695:1444-2049(-)